MAIKLIKACKELNIGMSTLTAWCEKNGSPVESDPNFRLDDEVFLALVKHFAPALESTLFEDGVYIPQVSVITKELQASVMADLCLGDGEIIGRYVSKGRCYVDDLRNPSFSRLVDKDNLQRKLKVYIDQKNFGRLQHHQYYRFKCTVKNVNPLLFDIDDSYKPELLSPKDIVQLLYVQNCPDDYNARKRTCQQLKMLETQLSGSGPDIFIYELLQNANDYPIVNVVNGEQLRQPVDVEFHLTNDYLIFEHSGEYFSPSNIAALCDFNAEEKAENKEAIGYKGIGFKTVFHSCNYVYLHTGKFSFSYDEKLSKSKTFFPWQIVPVWTDEENVNPAIKNILTQTKDKCRVQFALSPREKGLLNDLSLPQNFITLFRDIFKTERVILFIKNIRQVSIFFEGTGNEPIIQTKNSERWLVRDIEIIEDNIDPGITKNINLALTTSEDELSIEEIRTRQQLLMQGYDRIPPKYKNFTRSSVKFACQRDGRKLLPVLDNEPHIYCYLPARKVDWGFPFLMNSDMIPTGDRGDIEDIEVNHEIARLAGGQFFEWIKDLLRDDSIDPSSVFDLIPDFLECKKQKTHYSDFIEEFQKEFESLAHGTPFVPCVDKSGYLVYATIDDIINDQTNISAKGFMSDYDFITLCNTGCDYLPINELRSSESFHSFLYSHSPANYDFDYSKLKSVIKNDDFIEWLEDEENDANFICFLLDQDKLLDFSNQEIFVEAAGTLFASEKMYLDYDRDMHRIPFLQDYIPYLSPTLHERLKLNEKWEDYAEANFKEFKAPDMLRDYILEKEEALEQFKNKDNSINFFKFIAEKEVPISLVKNLVPFFDENGTPKTEYDKAYFYSDDADNVYRASWMPREKIYLLSRAYFDEPELNNLLLSTFAEAGVRTFSDNEFIQEKLVNDIDFAASVNEVITEHLNENLDFVNYVFEHRDALKDKDNQLKDYTLMCWNIKNNMLFLNKDDVRYFAHFTEPGNSSYEDNTFYSWIADDMMHAVHSIYIDKVEPEQKKTMESFLRQSFGVKTFTDKSFWTDVVYANRAEIFPLLSSKNTVLSFLDYLAKNSRILFDGSISFNELKDFPLLRSDGTISSDRDLPLYAYNDIAENLEYQRWYQKTFYLLDEEYSKCLDQKALQLLQIEQFDVQRVVDDLCKNISFDDDTLCIEFWQWIKANAKQITDFTSLQQVTMYMEDAANLPCKELYIPDVFFPVGEGIETLVRKFDPDARFVPYQLLQDGTETLKSEWLRLLKKLGAKADNKDILEHVLANLAEYKDEAILDSVLALLTLHKKHLIDNWEKYAQLLKPLKVRTRRNGYLTLDECVIVALNEGDAEAEPFSYIELGKEIAPEIFKANKDIVIRIAELFERNNIIEGRNRKVWAHYKIDEYINRIQHDDMGRNRIHVPFVRDLANWADSFELDKEQISKVQFLCKTTGYYEEASELTLGTLYKPTCNFEACKVKLNYITDAYITEFNIDVIRNFFKNNTDIHYRFEKEDIQYMSNRDFAIYIWTDRFKLAPVSFAQWIEDGEFNNKPCIPTATGVKCPEELYAPYLMEYVRYCDDYTNKIPAIDINKLNEGTSLFSKLPFRTTLTSSDCLAFLLKAREKNEEDTKHRKQVIEWLINNDDLSYDEVQNYRNNPEAKWKNGHGFYVHISELYAIHPSAMQERSVFSSDEHVIRTWSFPEDEGQFEDICDMLDIRVLKSEDFKTVPVQPVIPQTAEILEKLKVRLLILAAIDHNDRYAKYYEKYIETLREYGFYACEQIDLRYEELQGTVGQVYIDDTNKKVYYVTAWDDLLTFSKFCHAIKMLVGIRANDDICEEVFYERKSIDKLVDKYCYSLRSDKAFLKYMEDMKQRVIEVPEEFQDAAVKEMDYVSYQGGPSEDVPEEPIIKEPAVSTEPETTSSESPNEDIPVQRQAPSPSVEPNPIKHEDDSLDEYIAESKHEPEEELHLEATRQDDFKYIETEIVNEDGEDCEAVCEHYRHGTWVRTYTRSDGTVVQGHWRNGGSVSPHTRVKPEQTSEVHQGTYSGSNAPENENPISDTPRRPHRSTESSAGRSTSSSRQEPREPYTHNSDGVVATGTPIELEMAPRTEAEEADLRRILNGMSSDTIANNAYLANYRLYKQIENWKQEHPEYDIEPVESETDFVRNIPKEGGVIADHKLKNGKFMRACSAAGGVLYLSPGVWNLVADERCMLCVYRGADSGRAANEFKIIRSYDELLDFIGQDDLVIKVTGKHRVQIVEFLYNHLRSKVTRGTVYSLIRVAEATSIDNVVAPVSAAMTEQEDEDSKFF